MFTHPYTKEPLEFKSQEELLQFLQLCNPLMMRNFKEQYKAKYKDFEILDFGKNVEIRKIKTKGR